MLIRPLRVLPVVSSTVVRPVRRCRREVGFDGDAHDEVEAVDEGVVSTGGGESGGGCNMLADSIRPVLLLSKQLRGETGRCSGGCCC